jgi:hypothetical protein
MTGAVDPSTLTSRVLACCDAEDWAAAAEALSEHEQWIRTEVAAGRLRNEAELVQILAEQQQLGDELQRRLAETADQLGAIGQAGRGARAYRAESGD